MRSATQYAAGLARTALLFFCCLGVAFLSGAFISQSREDPDEPAHIVTGLMVHDYLAGGLGAHPLAFARDYYTPLSEDRHGTLASLVLFGAGDLDTYLPIHPKFFALHDGAAGRCGCQPHLFDLAGPAWPGRGLGGLIGAADASRNRRGQRADHDRDSTSINGPRRDDLFRSILRLGRVEIFSRIRRLECSEPAHQGHRDHPGSGPDFGCSANPAMGTAPSSFVLAPRTDRLSDCRPVVFAGSFRQASAGSAIWWPRGSQNGELGCLHSSG